MELFFEIPKVFFKKYFYELSSEAFCILINFYRLYLENDKVKEIELNYDEFQRQFNFLKDDILIWNELHELIIRHKENFYDLNIKKIKKDSLSKKILRKTVFRVKVIGQKAPIKDRKPEVLEFINKSFSKFSVEIQKRLIKFFEIIIKNIIDSNGSIRLSDINQYVYLFINENENDILQLCKVYDNPQYKSKTNINFIKTVLENLKKEKINIYKQTTETIKTYKSKREENKKILGLKIATGSVLKEDIQDTSYLAYLAYIKSKDYEKLIKLYKIGVEILKQEHRESEIFTNYEWLL